MLFKIKNDLIKWPSSKITRNSRKVRSCFKIFDFLYARKICRTWVEIEKLTSKPGYLDI